ncbi:MAG: sugar transferase [Burkholderiales bacterium]|nr:sugar transferase [Burkholderiales bacterium]
MAKRTFDLAVAALLLLLLSPLMAALAAWIKLDSPGPVFFRQTRVGRHGVPFRIHKFRTMVADAPRRGGALTVGADARITRAGAWLRPRRLDELPQLIDVLQGTMSLVGPRPEVPEYVTHYPEGLRAQALATRPGITSPGALEFLDEATQLARAADPEREYIDVILPRKVQLAADYAQQASLRTDLAVLWATLRRLLQGSGS